jgi:UDP-N-acetylmuramoyl-L-alanyl-D-glutamate--2,6-diaminopimelate ligase
VAQDSPAPDRLLGSLVDEIPGARLIRGEATTPITAVHHDSRLVGPGSLFVAIRGFTVDGHSFLPAVAAAGAAAALVEAGHELPALPPQLALIEVPAARPALSAASAWFYRHPGRELVVIGVTGTDGKTTTSHLLTSALEAAGARVGRLGTVDTYLSGETGPAPDHMTTPDAPEVQRLLRRMADAGCEFAIVESTSHGLVLNRLDHVDYDVAVLTNVTGDHFDFHGTLEAHRDALAQLFVALDRAVDKGVGKFAVVNADDPSADLMLSKTRATPLRFGLEAPEAEVVARNISLRPGGSAFRIVAPQGMVEVSMRLPALFNVMNALAAASAALTVGADLRAIARGLEEGSGVPGRMERVEVGQPFDVIVDYAHTGDAVRQVLEFLRDVCQGRLIIVVGAAGERDPSRRASVGRAAAEGADFAIFTSDDPRSEDPAHIVREIARHAESAGGSHGATFLEIPDRREAIATALAMARPGDTVLLAGKGHETSFVFSTGTIPWDDRQVARDELLRLGYGS